MKVALVSTWETDCGIAGYSGQLVPALRNAGVDVYVLAIDRRELKYLTSREMTTWWEDIADSCKGFDVVHVQHEFGFFAGSYGYRTSARVFRQFLRRLEQAQAPIVTTFHTEPFFFRGGQRRPDDLARDMLHAAEWRALVTPRFRFGHANWAVVHTRTSRRRLIDAGIPASRVRVIPQGLSGRPPGTRADRDRAVEDLGLPKDATMLGIFGFLSEQKGHTVALDALRHLPDDYYLLIGGAPHPFGGDQTLEEVLTALEESPSIRERVRLLGHLDDPGMDRFFNAVDVCLAPYLPRPTISSSAALSWALASGKPIIASRIPAFHELADQWDLLELVTPEAPRELARRIETLVADEDRRASLRASAEAYLHASSWDRVGETHRDLYDELLDHRGQLGIRARFRRGGHAATPGPQVVRGVRVGAAPPVTFVVRPGIGDPIADWIASHRRVEDEPLDLLRNLLKPGARLVDVGAHLGTFSVPAAAMGCEVLSVEGSPTNAALLRRAVEANDFSNMTVVHAAAGPADGTLEFTPNGPWGHGTLPSDIEAGVETVKVEQVSVDSLLERFAWEGVDVLKIDTEGAEAGVLKGARNLLARPDAPVVLFESNDEMLGHYGATAIDLRELFAELGFRLYFLDRDAGKRLVRVQPDTIQPACVADYVATKRPLDLPREWCVDELFTEDEIADRLDVSSRADHWPYRRYAARTIADGGSWMLERSDLRETLGRLAEDPHPAVRVAAGNGSGNGSHP